MTGTRQAILAHDIWPPSYLVAAMAGGIATAMPPIADPPEVKVIAVDEGIQLHYVERGRGEPVVFVTDRSAMGATAMTRSLTSADGITSSRTAVDTTFPTTIRSSRGTRRSSMRAISRI